jgi:RimJ/RimL family protein N-acetyltransferase
MPAMFRPTLPLETDRLTLRLFDDGDAPALYAIQRRPDVTRYLYWGPRSRTDVRQMIERRKGFTGFERGGDAVVLAAILRASGALIGDVMLHWSSEEHRQGEIGFVLHPDHHGHGYATEMSAAMLEMGFGVLRLHRIIGRCDARNQASAGVMERLGMRREAHLVENEFIKGEWAGELVYAILADEWAASYVPGSAPGTTNASSVGS